MTVLCQCWLMMFVTFVSQKRYLRSFQTSAMQKNLIPFGGELPSGLSNRDDTSAGTSCGWQFNPARLLPPGLPSMQTGARCFFFARFFAFRNGRRAVLHRSEEH